MYIKLLDSTAQIESKINKALAEEVNKKIRNYGPKIQSQIVPFVSSAIMNQPEVQSLVGGYLRGAFGLVDPNNSVDAIRQSVINSVRVSVKTYDDKLKGGGIDINVQPYELADILSLPEGHVVYEKGDLHWLKWLLTLGDTTIVINYEYVPGAGVGRSGLGTMEKGASFRVPPEFAGTIDNNFITRALISKESEQFITNIFQQVFQ
tara:strand:- start:6038 stop:6655 length:618 start_codon:yes stop_codon:yes gene_type:complete